MDNRYRFVVSFLAVLNALLIIMLCGLVRDTREDVNALRGELANKSDLANLAVPSLKFFHEDKCTGCHAERRFAGPHNTRGDMERAVAHMSAMPDAGFTDEDVAKIHRSLKLLRCTKCHGADTMRALAIKSPAERMRIVREMIDKPNSKISPDEAADILRAYEESVGF